MFSGCSKLQVVDMSNINLTSIESGIDVFILVNNLEYLNIRGIINNPSIQIFNSLSSMIELKVCQNISILEGENIKYDCCFFNEDDIACKSNYMIVYYGSNHTYTNGYKIDGKETYQIGYEHGE